VEGNYIGMLNVVELATLQCRRHRGPGVGVVCSSATAYCPEHSPRLQCY
jgi:hypothetical protein